MLETFAHTNHDAPKRSREGSGVDIWQGGGHISGARGASVSGVVNVSEKPYILIEGC